MPGETMATLIGSSMHHPGARPVKPVLLRGLSVFVCGLLLSCSAPACLYFPPLLAVVVLATPSSMNPMDVPCHLSSGLSTCYFFKMIRFDVCVAHKGQPLRQSRWCTLPLLPNQKTKYAPSSGGRSPAGRAWRGRRGPCCLCVQASARMYVSYVCGKTSQVVIDQRPPRGLLFTFKHTNQAKGFTAHFTHRWPGR